MTTSNVPAFRRSPWAFSLRHFAIALVMLWALAPATVRAQAAVWTQRGTGPSARFGHAMAFDSGRGVTVLFGGYTGSANGETWEWNGTTWTQRAVGGPSPRYAHAMAYDTARGVTVLFGGNTTGTNSGAIGETWEWNGTVWSQRAGGGPSPRFFHAMVYDAGRGVTVLFGGYNGNSGALGETWEWNGTAWTQRMVGGPSPRHIHAMAYDTARAVTVLFGGNVGGMQSGETWEWNGITWTQRAGGTPRFFHAMAYDTARGATVLFGGDTGIPNAETWEWRGSGWTQRAVSGPSARSGTAMAYDAGRGTTVLFGGLGDTFNGETWELIVAEITGQPTAQTACSGRTASFTVAAAGAGTLAYQWQVDLGAGSWTPLAAGMTPLPCGGYALATTPSASATRIGIVDCAGPLSVRALVSNSSVSVTSNPVTLTVCKADINCSGSISVQDIFDYLSLWFAGCP